MFMYMYIYICIYIHIYIIFNRLPQHQRLFSSLPREYINTNINMFMNIYMNTLKYIYIYIYTYVYIFRSLQPRRPFSSLPRVIRSGLQGPHNVMMYLQGIYICIYIGIYIRICICIYVCVYVYIRATGSTQFNDVSSRYIYTYKCMDIYRYIYLCIGIGIYIYMYVYIYTGYRAHTME
jgi:hypothetical protein